MERAQFDGPTEKCQAMAKTLVETIKAAQEFEGVDAPEGEMDLMDDIQSFEAMVPAHKERVNKVKVSQSTIYRLRIDLAKSAVFFLILFFMPLLSFGQHKIQPVTESDGVEFYQVQVKKRDTIPVRFVLSCFPGVIWKGYKVSVRLSDSAKGNIFLGPDKKRLPNKCQIVQFIK